MHIDEFADRDEIKAAKKDQRLELVADAIVATDCDTARCSEFNEEECSCYREGLVAMIAIRRHEESPKPLKNEELVQAFADLQANR